MSLVQRVFLSSTYKDLVEYREAARDALDRMGLYVVRMENFPASDWDADDFCRGKVQESNIFVGIIGGCYGSSPSNSGVSFTEREYLIARQLQKPCLLFLTPDDFPIPGNLIEEDRLRQKLADFRSRLRQAHTVRFFNSAETLKEAILITFLEHSSSFTQYQPTLATGGTIGDVSVGAYLPKSCNRRTQEAQFLSFVRRHMVENPGRPQIYAVHGNESERPRSFVDRLYHEKIKTWKRPDGDPTAIPCKVDIEWPRGSAPEEGYQELRLALFERFDPSFPRTSDISPAALHRLPKIREHSSIVIQHLIRSQYWEKDTSEIAMRYLDFWDEFGAAMNLTQFFIFLTVIYASRSEDYPRPVNPERMKRKIQKDLRKLVSPAAAQPGAAEGARLILDELSCVRLVEVQDWLASPAFKPLFPLPRDSSQHAENLFATSPGGLAGCKAMAEVEDDIDGMLHHQFNPVR